MDLVFFKSQAEFRRWLSRHHATTGELVVGLYHIDSGLGD